MRCRLPATWAPPLWSHFPCRQHGNRLDYRFSRFEAIWAGPDHPANTAFTNAFGAIAVVSTLIFPELACESHIGRGARKLMASTSTSDQRRGIRLPRLLALVVDLRDLHLCILCDRGPPFMGLPLEMGLGIPCRSATALSSLISFPAGRLWHHADKSFAVGWTQPLWIVLQLGGRFLALGHHGSGTTSGTGSDFFPAGGRDESRISDFVAVRSRHIGSSSR